MSAGGVPLLDERDPAPVRARIGSLLERAAEADFAVTRIRLRALDFTASEVAGVRRCRVLLGRLDAGTLLDAPDGSAGPAAKRLEVLGAFAASGRLEVRAAGMATWSPDFSVFALPGPRDADGTRPTGPALAGPGTRVPGPAPAAVGLVGAHYFGTPYPTGGPTFTAVIQDADGVALLGGRFEELWEFGHDVLPAIRDALEEAHALALEAARRGGRPDRPDAAVGSGRDG